MSPFHRKIALTVSAVSVFLCAAVAAAPEDLPGLDLFAPLPQAAASTASGSALVTLGRMLYFEPRLSRNQEISCNSCHPLSRHGADGLETSVGYRGQRGSRNAPTVYNAAAHLAQFWDGRAATVEEQATGPVLNPVEMAMPSAKAVVDVLESIPEYVAAFRAAFPGEEPPVTLEHVGKSIGAFERGLITPSRWDAYLRGDQNALTAAEKNGFQAFVAEGCTACHSGVLVGGAGYRKLGLARAYPDASDPGRYQVTKADADRAVFKVPSLRNVAGTAPYFHNGKVSTLDEAVRQMGQYQLGRNLAQARVDAISAWLNTLTGEPPAGYIAAPELPPSGPRTPSPAAQ